ncbi:MAG: hypothetical protein QNJ84_15290 [Alphaproteobacteria bacterium]|nr:hypothetical protein [Alphaproteobacteria bacterium]
MAIEAPYYPIIYVRGYAATMGEIEDTVATPYMGFNLGSTKIRQDYNGEITPFIFESPLIRLIKDEKYEDAYRNGGFPREGEQISAKSVWVFRYYEPVSEDLGDGERRTIPQFALDLRRFILRVRDTVCPRGDDAARAAFKVHLVAHSMGGLVCRCYLQNICRHGARALFGDNLSSSESDVVDKTNDELELAPTAVEPLVDKVFTYATPHNGIEMAGKNVPDLGSLSLFHARNFNRKVMREYLAISDRAVPVNSLDGAFQPERFFCFVGTNYRDYSAFFGLAKKGTGAMSDGLVMIKNASVRDAPRAFANRSHSGHYGVVNSEEGYQNLKRFLFGDLRVRVELIVDEIILPAAIERAVGIEDGDNNEDENREKRERVKAAYNIEAVAAVRGLGVVLNERRVAQESAIRRTYEQLAHDQKPIYLFSGHLLKDAKTLRSKDTALAFTISLGVQTPLYEVDRRFWFDDYFEGDYVFQDLVTFRVPTEPGDVSLSYGVRSVHGAEMADAPLQPADLDGGRLLYQLPVGFKTDTNPKPKPGFRGRLRLTVSPSR